MWSTNNRSPLKLYTGHTSNVTCLDFSKNMVYLITAGHDLSIRVNSIDEEKPCRILYTQYPVTFLDINEVGTILVSGDTHN